MTQARNQLVNPNYAGTYHCINRCVRRSWLCGFDRYTKRSFEHRKPWVEARILELGEIFACGISLSEYIARRANAEDKISGKFWEG
jgi:hypothetical protein